MKALRFAFLALLVFLFSCDNGFNSYSGFSSAPESKNHTVKCYISLDGAVPEEVASAVQDDSLREGSVRSAVPTINTTDYYYFVEAVKSDGTKKEYGKEQAANFITTSSAGMIVFEFPLEDGSWTVTSGVKNQENETVLSYTIPEPVVVSPDETVLDLHFVVRPQEGGFGKIQLDFFTDGLSSDFSVSRIMAECNSPAWKSVNEDLTKCDLIPASGKATLYVPSIASGAYEITFTFYDSSSIILYQTTQTINVLAGMKTKRWVSGGGSDNTIIEDGKLTLNTDAINDFARRIFYVGDTTHGTATGDGEGTAYKPFNSFEKALATIEKTKSETKDYTIHLTGTQTAATAMSSGRAWVVPEGIHSLTIVGDKGLKADGMPDAVLNANKKGSVLEAKSNLILKNVQLTGGYANGSSTATKNGGGIYIDSGVKVTLDSGTLIGDVITPAGNAAATKSSCGNYAYNWGGGIYMKDATLVVKSGAKISHNYTGTGASASANLSGHEGHGGGISCEKGKITLESGSSVSYNGTEQRGGGIHLSNTASGNTELVMNGADVSHNETIGWGGGIYMGGSSVKVTIKDSSVSYNKCVGTCDGWGQSGGGFFLDGGNLTIKGNSIIERNETYYGAGAIFPCNNRGINISFEGGTIRNNTATSGVGGLVFYKGNTFNFSGSVYIPYGVDGEKAEGKNGLVLGEDAVITVAGNLIAPADGSKNAYIIPANWSRGLQVLTAATAKLIEDNASKFGTADDDYEVVAKNTAGIIDAPIYVASSITTGAGARKLCTGEPSSDDDARGTRAKPFATMSQAIALLTDSTVDYEIRIDGTISGRNAHTDITSTTQAASVLIHGANGDNTNDALNQNNLGVSNNGGSVLVINNDIPVTIKNLKITGGNANGSSGDFANGGGIFVKKGSLCLDDGAFITKNSAASSGGGVYVEKDMNLYMCGTAKIGGTGAGEGNTAQMGGGLYNKQGFVYLGKSSGSTESELTGGIYGNTSTKEGGGISISGSGYNVVNLEMLSGNIEGNKVDGGTSGGGGVYLHCTVFDLKGGAIKNNSIENPGISTSGGAININTVATLKIGGSVSIPYGGAQYKNDIAQKSSNTIELSSALNENFSAAVVANSYEVDSEILSGTASLLSSECYKFYASKPDSVEEQLFVLDDGKLGPIVTYPNGISDGTETKDGLTYNAIKYSFKNADNLRMHIPDAYKENGYVVVKVDGAAPETAELKVSESETETINILDDGYHTVTVTLSNYMSEPIVIEKRMYVKIKPIRLLYQNLEWGQIGAQYVCFANWVTGRVDIRGQVKVNGTAIFDCTGSNYTITAEEWYNLDWESTGRKFDKTFTSKSDELALYFNIWRNADYGAGAHTITRTLEEIKKVTVAKAGSSTSEAVENWVLWSDNQTNPTGEAGPTIAVKVKFNTYE